MAVAELPSTDTVGAPPPLVNPLPMTVIFVPPALVPTGGLTKSTIGAFDGGAK
jgi:hypothetical protein